MTVCIASICEYLGEEAIITACDQMVSMGGFVSGDHSVRKIDPILYDWTMMFAADDISPTIPILGEMDKAITPPTLKGVAELIKKAYENERSQQIEDEILRPIGLSMNSFLTNGKNQLSERVYERIFERVNSHDLQVEFLVQGYDSEKREPHIFTVSNPGKCSYYDKVGFWAIGSGQHQAIASLFSTEYDTFDALEKCIAKVLVAKFRAEASTGVGKETWLLVSRKDIPNSTIFIDLALQSKIRQEYVSLPKIPSKILPEIKDAITKQAERKQKTTPQLTAQTSAPKP